MALNTTRHLLSDLERLGKHLGEGKWLLQGRVVGRDALPRLRGAVPRADQRDTAHAQTRRQGLFARLIHHIDNGQAS